jgi:protein-L-isoaspartate(D-aspartate) O-methyltransferase
VLQAMRSVPRHRFVPVQYRDLSYSDGPVPIGEGQTISQPFIVALMSQMLALHGDETVLEVGTGSGYQAAVLGHLAKQVYTIERHALLAKRASKELQELGLSNVLVYVGDGSLGLLQHAPFDAILVTAAAPETPRVLLEQLAPGGRLVIPVGSRGAQFLERWQHKGAAYKQDVSIPVAFVPLVGRHGWRE